MKKPEKKTKSDKNLGKSCKGCCSGECNFCKIGYNQAIDEYEEFLPSDEEILQIPRNHFATIFQAPITFEEIIKRCNNLAKTISKRLGR